MNRSAIAVALLVLLVVVAVYVDRSSGPQGVRIRAGTVSDFPSGSITPMTLEAKLTTYVPRLSDRPGSGVVEVPVFIVNDPTRGLVVLYASDPHLGCRVNLASELPDDQGAGLMEDAVFYNPCHGEQYDQLGRHLSGPSPRGLDRFGVSVEGDDVVVNLSAFSFGSPPLSHIESG